MRVSHLSSTLGVREGQRKKSKQEKNKKSEIGFFHEIGFLGSDTNKEDIAKAGVKEKKAGRNFKKNCAGRESNPGLPRGRREFCP